MILLLVLTLVFVAIGTWGLYKESDGAEMVGWMFAGFLGIALVCCFGYWLSVQGRYGELRGFRQSIEVMESSIAATSDAFYAEGGKTGIGVDLPNAKQSTNLSESIAQYAEKVLKYNRTVGYYRSLRDSFWGRGFIPKVPDDLQPIEAVNFSAPRKK